MQAQFLAATETCKI